MALVEENEVVEHFGPERFDKPLAECVGLGGSVGSGDATDAHGLKEPLIQVATEGAIVFIPWEPVLAKDPVVVVDQIGRFLLKGDRAFEGVFDEGQGGMVRDPKVDNLAALQVHDHKDGEHFKVGQMLLKEVAAEDSFGLLLQKGSPSASRSRAGSFGHVFANGASAHNVAKLDLEFQRDAFGAPTRVFCRKASDQILDFFGDGGPSWSAFGGVRLLPPEIFEQLLMPSNNGFRLNNLDE